MSRGRCPRLCAISLPYAALTTASRVNARGFTVGKSGCGVWSMASGVSGAAPAAYAADVAPSGMNAAAMSAYRMLSDLGYVLGPLVLGAVTDLLGADVALGSTAVLLIAVALLFARFASETYRAGRAG